jgi:DNA-binding NarL/FixJ family response regulator
VRVAIVDDTPDIRLLVRMTLERDPEIDVVAEAEDGRGAIEIAESFAPEVMLLDLSMPVMDGMQALPRVIEASPSTAVLVLSGFSAAELAQQAVAAGARGYLCKGIAAEELRRRVWEASGQTPQGPGGPEGREAAPPDPVDEQATLREVATSSAEALRLSVAEIARLADSADRSGHGDLGPALRRQADVLGSVATDLDDTVRRAQTGRPDSV